LIDRLKLTQSSDHIKAPTRAKLRLAQRSDRWRALLVLSSRRHLLLFRTCYEVEANKETPPLRSGMKKGERLRGKQKCSYSATTNALTQQRSMLLLSNDQCSYSATTNALTQQRSMLLRSNDQCSYAATTNALTQQRPML